MLPSVSKQCASFGQPSDVSALKPGISQGGCKNSLCRGVGGLGRDRGKKVKNSILLLPHATHVHVLSCKEPGQPLGAANITTSTLSMEGSMENSREIRALDLSVAYETKNNLISDYMRSLSLSDFQHCRLWCLA